MRHSLSLLLLLFVSLLTGTLAMALERPRPSINQRKIDVIKQEMNFAQFIRQLPPDKRVILDWPALLSEFKDAEGVVWRATDGSSSFDTGHGEIGVTLKSNTNDGNGIGITIHSLSLGQEDAIDLALFDSTNSNAPFVPYKYEPQCVGTFCLVPRQGDAAEEMMFVYGNILIKLRCSGGSILPIARALQFAMEKAVAVNPEGKLPARPKITYTVNPTHIKVGESFTVTAKFSAGLQMDPKTFGVAKELLSNNIEYKKNLGGGVYRFNANAPGPGTVAFSLLDKKTLWVFTDTVPVTIEPAQ